MISSSCDLKLEACISNCQKNNLFHLTAFTEPRDMMNIMCQDLLIKFNRNLERSFDVSFMKFEKKLANGIAPKLFHCRFHGRFWLVWPSAVRYTRIAYTTLTKSNVRRFHCRLDLL